MYAIALRAFEETCAKAPVPREVGKVSVTEVAADKALAFVPKPTENE